MVVIHQLLMELLLRPHAAGIAGLILSVAPLMTPDQVCYANECR